MQQDPARVHPSYWAAFVVIGDDAPLPRESAPVNTSAHDGVRDDALAPGSPAGMETSVAFRQETYRMFVQQVGDRFMP